MAAAIMAELKNSKIKRKTKTKIKQRKANKNKQKIKIKKSAQDRGDGGSDHGRVDKLKTVNKKNKNTKAHRTVVMAAAIMAELKNSTTLLSLYLSGRFVMCSLFALCMCVFIVF